MGGKTPATSKESSTLTKALYGTAYLGIVGGWATVGLGAIRVLTGESSGFWWIAGGWLATRPALMIYHANKEKRSTTT